MTKLIYCLATFGFGCQGVMKIYSYIITRRRVIELYMINVKYNERMMNQSDRVKRVLCENATITHILIKGTMLVYIILVCVTVTIPGLSSIFLSSRILPFGFVLPFLDPETWTGYIWNYAFQVIMSYFYLVLTLGGDITTIFNLLTAYGQLDALMMLIEECNEQLARNEPAEAIQKKIVDIVQLHQHHRLYLQQLVDFLNPYHFVTVGSTVPAMVISVLGVMLLKWYPGAVIMFLGSVQIFYICFLGTGLELKTDALTDMVGAIRWDKLSVRDMKHMQLILALTQQPKVLLVATTPLNVTAFLQIHKFIYSLIMMVENTKE
ncbi:AGAP010507-PA-like protein [Anopheles sinensis]|uniref:AGAP010507-PA-like protein n=1 Tax=Anopheles sinensis TaxID=74873 RepID=A0A084WAL4_ANOSI|nr:AGAP010507-PA-like protein [Anopheles sinensis]